MFTFREKRTLFVSTAHFVVVKNEPWLDFCIIHLNKMHMWI